MAWWFTSIWLIFEGHRRKNVARRVGARSSKGFVVFADSLNNRLVFQLLHVGCINISQIPYYLDEDSNWSLNIYELQRSLDNARPHCVPRALVVINPGNPTGEYLALPGIEGHCETRSIFMAALCNRGHYIFVLCLPYFYTWCDPSANLECMSETCCTRLAGNSGRKNRQKFAILAPSHNFIGLYLRN